MELPVILRNACGGSKLIHAHMIGYGNHLADSQYSQCCSKTNADQLMGKQQIDSCDLFLFY